MPELPEVETVRRNLEPLLVGRQVTSVRVHRRDVVHGPCRPTALLLGRRIAAVRRHGKQLAIIADQAPQPCVCVHLGMSGSLVGERPPARGSATHARPRNHRHVVWTLDDGMRLVFRDPRRFGGIWAFASEDGLVGARWCTLGPDALAITPRQLHAALRSSARPLKAALLDQGLIAGLGNIYVDELLFRCRLHPQRRADTLSNGQWRGLITVMRRLLNTAITCGGSSIRDYVNANGSRGRFHLRHQVYGRGGLPCRRCGTLLTTAQVAGRTTVSCASCQPAAIARVGESGE